MRRLTVPVLLESNEQRQRRVMRKPTKALLTALGAVLLTAGGILLGWSGQGTALTREEDVRQVIKSLPQGSPLRTILEQGSRGNGIHYPWMDKMRQLSVKRALVTTTFEWHDGPTDVALRRIVYFSKYDESCAQISDPKWLERIRVSGLEQQLVAEAVRRTRTAHWYRAIDNPVPHEDRGICPSEFADDEWLPIPVAVPALYPEPSKFDDLLRSAVQGNELDVERLTNPGLPRDELTKALWNAIIGGDSCVVRTLLLAGADPNARDAWGGTPLIEAAKYGSASVVKALLEERGYSVMTARDGQEGIDVYSAHHTEIASG